MQADGDVKIGEWLEYPSKTSQTGAKSAKLNILPNDQHILCS